MNNNEEITIYVGPFIDKTINLRLSGLTSKLIFNTLIPVTFITKTFALSSYLLNNQNIIDFRLLFNKFKDQLYDRKIIDENVINLSELGQFELKFEIEPSHNVFITQYQLIKN